MIMGYDYKTVIRKIDGHIIWLFFFYLVCVIMKMIIGDEADESISKYKEGRYPWRCFQLVFIDDQIGSWIY